MPGMLLGVAFTAMDKTVWRATKPVIFMWINRLSSLITSIFSLEMPYQRDSIFSALEERTRRAIRTSALFSSENSLAAANHVLGISSPAAEELKSSGSAC